MRWRSLVWLVVSVLCFIGAAYFWQLGEKWAGRGPGAKPTLPATQQHAEGSNPGPISTPSPTLSTNLPGNLNSLPASAPFATNAASRFINRLSNTTKSGSQLGRSEKAILLENALLDTEKPIALAIPDHLQAHGDPGTYIVQSRTQLDDAFRALLKGVGATIVAYIPNNAYLVRATQDVAGQLAAQPQTQTVLPYEPYFKLKPSLLELAIYQKPVPENTTLNLLLFPDARESTIAALSQLGAEVVGEDRSPFGAELKVRAPVNGLSAVAGLAGVQAVELARMRKSANDLSRARLGVAGDSVTATNYLGLTGKGSFVNVNDTGVDSSHPDLAGRVFGDFGSSMVDTVGHGTHVAGIIAGSGAQSLTVSNAQGSSMPAVAFQFRGMAPAANLFSMLSDPNFGPSSSDSYLQEQAARTNVFISNNSWHYFNDFEYDMAAASYDAAVRDAIPELPGSQPLLFVFSAGNDGSGSDVGTEGIADTISSPGTAKNVITVGAIEQLRNITNEVWKCTPVGTNQNCVTNTPWTASSDSDQEVASFSSRGNVGIGIEGDFGRFKPDVVAPGTFVVSTRSGQWDEAAYYNPTSHQFAVYQDLLLSSNSVFNNAVFVPANAVQVNISVLPNFTVPSPTPDLQIYVRQSEVPTTNAGDYTFVRVNDVSMPPDGGPNLSPRDTNWYYAIFNPNAQTVEYDLLIDLVLTNDNGNYFEVLSNLNDSIGGAPYFYRYESGTSMAAAGVSGTLALIEEFFEQGMKQTNSPALMKAMLINGARSVGDTYNFGVQNEINFQGWGLVSLPTSLPPTVSNAPPASASMKIFDQSPKTALATGQKHTYNVSITAAAQNVPLRVTLAWTDPPGNPVAGIKLVNDLDLIVTNNQTGDTFFGNDIVAGTDFNEAWDTNGAPNVDFINNVENVYLSPFLGTNYTIVVMGNRVNVNAVTGHTNNVVQDYALVISSGDGEFSDALTVTDNGINTPVRDPLITIMDNTFGADPNSTLVGGFLLNQHVGANSPLLGTNTVPITLGGTNSAGVPNAGAITIGTTNQWHFYVLVDNTSFTNAIFATVQTPTLSIPREGVNEFDVNNATRDSDVDIYVSTNRDLTNLSPTVIASAWNSVSRGGTEVVLLTNASAGTYYIGVKSESQEAAEYIFVGLISQFPFDSSDQSGNHTLHGFPPNAAIPDGSPLHPGITNIYAFGLPLKVRRAIATNIVSHQLFGDLVGTLTDVAHQATRYATLNNHAPDNEVINRPYVYDDSGQGDVITFGGVRARRTDGPGSLRNFAHQQSGPLFRLRMVDNALTHLGTNNSFGLFLEKQQDLQQVIEVDIPPGGCVEESVDVLLGATNLTILANMVAGGPITMQVCPLGASGSDCQMLTISTPGVTNTIVFDKTSTPPLNPGTYVITLCNPTAGPVTVFLGARVLYDLNDLVYEPFKSTAPTPIADDAVSFSSIFVSTDQKLIAVQAGVRIDHPRVSDLVLHLISPNGTRLLLQENRGGLNSGGMGYDETHTNQIPVSHKGGNEPVTNVFDTGQTAGSIRIDWNFINVPDWMHVYYENNLIFDSGIVNGIGTTNLNYAGASTLITVVMNQGGNTNWPTTEWSYTIESATADYHYVTFTENTNETVTPIKFAIPPFTNANYIGTSTNAELTNGIFFLPEDSRGMDVFRGEDALGTWTLEVWDNRVGATNPTPVLLGWQLSFIFENEVPLPVGLTNDVPVTNTVPAGQIQYYIVDVPDWPSFATNTLITASGPVNLLFNQGGRPTGTNAGDFNLLANSTGGSFTLSTNTTPPLVRSARYFLGVQNTNAAPVTFALSFDFDVTPLTNGIPVTSTIASGSIARYFSYDVTSNETAVSFQLTNLSGNVNLVARKGVPFPTAANYDYGSFYPGTVNESIVIFTNSEAFPLSPGRWYLAVVNADTTSVNYTIVVTDYTNALPNIITLINMVPYVNTNSGVAPSTVDYYRFVVSQSAVRVQFEIDNPSADMTLVARKGLPLPDLSSFDFISANPGLTNELITIFNNSAPIPLSPGEWYLSAVNVSGGQSIYTIMASEYLVTGTNIVITNEHAFSNSFCISWTSLPNVRYFVQGKTDLQTTNWVTIAPQVIATGYLATYCIPLPSPYHFFRVGEGVGLPSGPVAVGISSITVNGSGVLLQWSALTNHQYQVQWATSLASPVVWNTFSGSVSSTSGNFSFLDNGSQSGGLGVRRFYRLRQLP
jgi:subtilisin-like proprotein convertase family protein